MYSHIPWRQRPRLFLAIMQGRLSRLFFPKKAEAERTEQICMQSVMMITFMLPQAVKQARSPVTPLHRRRMLIAALREWGQVYKTMKRGAHEKAKVLPELLPKLDRLSHNLIELTSGRMDDDPAAYAALRPPTDPPSRYELHRSRYRHVG